MQLEKVALGFAPPRSMKAFNDLTQTCSGVSDGMAGSSAAQAKEPKCQPGVSQSYAKRRVDRKGLVYRSTPD